MKKMDVESGKIRNTLLKAINTPEILALLAPRGYDIEQLQEGLVLYEQAYESLRMQGVAHFDQVNATQSFYDTWRLTKVQFSHDVRLARMALKGFESTQNYLQLDSARPEAFEKWFVLARDFYTNLNGQVDLQSAVAKFGLTSERIAQGLQQLQALSAARSQQVEQKGDVVSNDTSCSEGVHHPPSTHQYRSSMYS